MEPFTFQIYNAFKAEMNDAAEAFIAAAVRNNDPHIYENVTIKLRKPTKTNTKAVAYLTLEMEVEYHDIYGEDKPFDDDYVFKYALYADGRVGRITPQVPYSQQQVFDAYQAWGLAIHGWIDQIKAHYDLIQRKERFSPVHEELAQKMWSPVRVASLLEQGGWDLVDALS